MGDRTRGLVPTVGILQVSVTREMLSAAEALANQGNN